MPNTYTAEKIAAVKQIIVARSLSRAEAVKQVRDYFNLGDRQARDVYAKYFTKETATALLNVTEEEVDDLPDGPGIRSQFKGDLGEISLTDVSPHTLDELLKASGVDLEIWEVERYITNTWQMGRKDKKVNLTFKNGVTNGYVTDSGGITKAPLWQVKAWLRKKVEASTINQMLERFLDKAARHAPKR